MVWLVGGAFLMLLEMFLPGVFLMWLGIAGLGVGVLVLLFDPAFSLQVLAFAVLAAASIALGLRLRGRRAPPVLNTPASGLVGRQARVLTFDGREGRVRVGDSDWAARLAEGTAAPPAGALLLVVAVEGTMLVVVPAA